MDRAYSKRINTEIGLIWAKLKMEYVREVRLGNM